LPSHRNLAHESSSDSSPQPIVALPISDVRSPLSLLPLPEDTNVPPPAIEDPELLLELINSGKVEIITADREGIATIPCSTSTQSNVWNTNIENIFLPPKNEYKQEKTQGQNQKNKFITSFAHISKYFKREKRHGFKKRAKGKTKT